MDRNSVALTMQQYKTGAPTHGVVFHVAIFVVSFLILFSRRPDAILNAQFYAEDGARWFAEAYQFGWRCLLMPESGYLQTASRLVALLSLLFPFAQAPLVMNLCALAVQISPVNIFLSSRFDSIPIRLRLVACFVYLALPNSFEVHANTTNMQWHLALAGLLLLLGRTDTGSFGRGFSLLILGLSVLDGPTGVLILPIVIVLYWIRKDTQVRAVLVALATGSAIQILALLLSNSRRSAPNGATLERLTSILGGQVFLSSILGVRTSIQLFFGHSRYLFVAQILALVIGSAVLLYALWHGSLELRLFLLFAAAILIFALIRPVATTTGNLEQWQALAKPGVGNRYYFFPMLAFFAALVWLAVGSAGNTKVVRYVALALLALLPIGIVRDWKYKPFVDYDFKAYAADFERAKPGTTVSIPINPDWQLVLVKH